MTFTVIFEEQPNLEYEKTYNAAGRSLDPLSQRSPGFIENIRYRSLNRDGWMLSLNSWKDEEALIRWREDPQHRKYQRLSREKLLLDYRLRVVEILPDATPSTTLDMTSHGVHERANVVLINMVKPAASAPIHSLEGLTEWLGISVDASMLSSWDIYEEVQSPDHIIVILSWASAEAAATFVEAAKRGEGIDRLRQVHVLRDYGMIDRSEAP